MWIMRAIAGRDAGALLAAVLQRVQGQIGQLRSFGVAINGDYAAFFVEFIEHVIRHSMFEGVGGGCFRMRASDR